MLVHLVKLLGNEDTHLVELLGDEDTQLHPSLLDEPVHPDTSEYKTSILLKYNPIFLRGSVSVFKFRSCDVCMEMRGWDVNINFFEEAMNFTAGPLQWGAPLNFNRLAYFHSLSQALHWGSIIIILILGSSSSPISPFILSRYLNIQTKRCIFS